MIESISHMMHSHNFATCYYIFSLISIMTIINLIALRICNNKFYAFILSVIMYFIIPIVIYFLIILCDWFIAMTMGHANSHHTPVSNFLLIPIIAIFAAIDGGVETYYSSLACSLILIISLLCGMINVYQHEYLNKIPFMFILVIGMLLAASLILIALY